MIQCPKCSATFVEARFSGWIVMGHGFCAVDKSGTIQTVGPIVPEVSVEPGKNIMESNVDLVCPHCQQRQPIKSYSLIRPCVLTGQRADTTIRIFTGDEMPVAAGILDWCKENLVNPPAWASTPAAIDASVHRAYTAYMRG